MAHLPLLSRISSSIRWARTTDTPAAPPPITSGSSSARDTAYQVCRRSLLRRSSIPLDIRPIRLSDLRAPSLYRPHREHGVFLHPLPCRLPRLGTLRRLRFPLPRRCRRPLRTPLRCDLRPPRIRSQRIHQNGWRHSDCIPSQELVPPRPLQLRPPEEHRCPRSRGRRNQTGAFLHRFMWLDDVEIGEIPFVWNFLVGQNKVDPAGPEHTALRAIHYICGGPWFKRYKDCDFADLWNKELNADKKAEKEKDRKVKAMTNA